MTTDTAQMSSTAQCAHAAAKCPDDCIVPDDCRGLSFGPRPPIPEDVHLDFVCVVVGLSGLSIPEHPGQDDAVGTAGGPASVSAHQTPASVSKPALEP